ncbi:dehydrogenase [Paenibacillus sp. J31TS4]|uniref:Gfo/Idh/MocA family protein n=1 Tax=Paenibacillus sp. J31TS4 TaxID=2807195 RepID=UPI001B1A3F61|nr:Gfo/Idh/MocA family oxidoreductase [Paenibacillus sp. J31TS4]GIP37734.1 dehydrogenase [Paenibacillus sp. J31TS4]
MTKIRTAVVGLNMGLQHAYAYAASEGAELRWVVDLDRDKAERVATELGCRAATDWTQVLDDVDAVSLCTPHHLHASQSLEAIAAGKHVLLEKPLAHTPEDCEAILRAAEEKGIVFMMAYIVRYLPIIRKLKELVETEAYGKPFNADCWIQGYLPPMPGSWFSRKETLGGGVLFSHGCHYVDLLLWLLGEPVSAVAVGTRSGTEWMEGEGTSHGVLTFEGGAVAHLETSWGIRYKETPALLHLHTPQALLTLNSGMSELRIVDEQGSRTLFGPVTPLTPQEGTKAIYEIEHFLSCIREGREPETGGREALRSHRAIWDMYRNGERVTMEGREAK